MFRNARLTSSGATRSYYPVTGLVPLVMPVISPLPSPSGVRVGAAVPGRPRVSGRVARCVSCTDLLPAGGQGRPPRHAVLGWVDPVTHIFTCPYLDSSVK